MELLKQILGNAAALSVVLGVFAFVFKRWIVASIQSHFDKELEKAKASLHVEGDRYAHFVKERDTIYPEILETVYRLRNGYRDFVDAIPTDGIRILQRRGSFPTPPQESSDLLYMLSENLYKYRAVIDEDTFRLLHTFKRRLQDGKVLLDRVTRTTQKSDAADPADWERTNEDAIRQRYTDSEPELLEIRDTVNDLYEQITARIKTHVDSVIEGMDIQQD